MAKSRNMGGHWYEPHLYYGIELSYQQVLQIVSTIKQYNKKGDIVNNLTIVPKNEAKELEYDYHEDDSEFIKELLEMHLSYKYNIPSGFGDNTYKEYVDMNDKDYISVYAYNPEANSRWGDEGCRDATVCHYIIGIKIYIDSDANNNDPKYIEKIVNNNSKKIAIIFDDLLKIFVNPTIKISYVLGVE